MRGGSEWELTHCLQYHSEWKGTDHGREPAEAGLASLDLVGGGSVKAETLRRHVGHATLYTSG